MKNILITIFAAALAFGCTQNTQTMNRDFLQLAADRYSVRSFDSAPVGQDDIDKILKAGQLAPTAINSQPQKIYVVRTPEAIAALNTVSPCLYGAPQCFVFCYEDARVCPRESGGNWGDVDVTIVLTHMALEAENLGIGTCIVGYFDPAKLAEVMNLPATEHPVLLMPFGYPTADCKPSPKHTETLPLEDMVEYR